MMKCNIHQLANVYQVQQTSDVDIFCAGDYKPPKIVLLNLEKQ